MEVSIKMIDDLAHLARLNFTEEEKIVLQSDLTQMIGFIEQLNEVNTEGIAPLLHMSHSINALREDEIKGSITQEEALQNAPDKDEKFFKVPKVIKK
jgi:aspartyl-tRNA(Asn)/glutamyl-tRNA(Gln) amidotransferase subunit C